MIRSVALTMTENKQLTRTLSYSRASKELIGLSFREGPPFLAAA